MIGAIIYILTDTVVRNSILKSIDTHKSRVKANTLKYSPLPELILVARIVSS
jgi:hypothetical protein